MWLCGLQEDAAGPSDPQARGASRKRAAITARPTASPSLVELVQVKEGPLSLRGCGETKTITSLSSVLCRCYIPYVIAISFCRAVLYTVCHCHTILAFGAAPLPHHFGFPCYVRHSQNQFVVSCYCLYAYVIATPFDTFVGCDWHIILACGCVCLVSRLSADRCCCPRAFPRLHTEWKRGKKVPKHPRRSGL